MKKIFNTVSPELIIWTIGLILLAFLPFGIQHISLCPIKNAGVSFCPGCGLGRSIHLLFALELRESFNSHPLGIFALIMITWRIINLIRTSLTHLNIRNNNG